MPAMIQVQNVPDAVHRALKVRAALAGQSLNDLILDELASMAALPSEEELKARLKTAERLAIKKCPPSSSAQNAISSPQ